MNLEQKERYLRSLLQEQQKLAIAFSGGVDSTYLLAVALQEIGPDVLAITACGPLSPPGEVEEAARLAASLGVVHLLIQSPLPGDPQFDSNPIQRCYICKKKIFSTLREEARRRGFQQLADGTNADDINSFRPGLQAIEELNISTPLKEAGLTKEEVRGLSRRMGLPTWNRPSSPCLATRFPYGVKITPDRLDRVKNAERSLALLDLGDLRLRYHGDLARLELPLARLPEVLEKREEIVRRVKEAGFLFVALDLEGYRSGSFDHIGMLDFGAAAAP